MSPLDDTVQRIKEAFRLYCHGQRAEGRSRMTEVWEEFSPAGPGYYSSLAAHYLADMADDPKAELAWDRKALEVADAALNSPEPDATAGALRAFLPSLHLNLADDLRKIGDFVAARRHLELGFELVDGLPIDNYGRSVRAELLRVESQIDELDSGPAVVFDFD